ncbi:imidazole glycerol phosphate synthase, glutamine amidotransferase subunit [Pandoraea communis]|uniref:Imidazole glycerol phosphate synthase subunit HisH n=1 Tax=Pandoraea communis TaxID=2508297 RepID=A0A5E4T4S2_9BURK|nr:imidazole glycerol phosphate synthase subunit HisH [Pandoraea communis]VVD82825.1 imidazole glycerol phosphate synthase, glutamine amidotransferase subunit [Pandoraea communis]
MIRIVDYGVGNIQAFMNMFRRLDIPAERAKSAGELSDATHLILPGVGAFDHAMQLLNASGMRPTLEQLVLEKQMPVLGVCVGMQMLATGSDEGELPGLNWIPGRVRSFANTPESAKMPMPHMGWNDLAVRDGAALFQRGFDARPLFYFLHSYYFDASDKAHVAVTANYGFDFDAVVSRDHIHGVQCHPEKSHHWGGQLLKNFAES